MTKDQIKIVDYRNARYQGEMQDEQFDGTGILLTDDLTFCLANWRNSLIEGNAYIIFPNMQTIYGEFQNGEINGFCCYSLGEECQIYCLAENGRITDKTAAVFPFLNSQSIQTSEQQLYNNDQQKWNKISQIIGIREIPQSYKQPRKYILKNIIEPAQSILQYSKATKFIFGFKQNGIKAIIDKQNNCIEEFGVYNDANILSGMGKKIINKEKSVIEEGLYDRPNQLRRYVEKPKQLKKMYKNFFMQSLLFENKFISLRNFRNIQKYFTNVKIGIIDNTTKKIAQQLIEGNKQTFSYPAAKPQNISKIKQRYEPIPQQQVSIEMLKQELNRSKSHKNQKLKKYSSPYKQMTKNTPAELKYISRTLSNNTSFNQNSDNQISKIQKRYQREPIDHNLHINSQKTKYDYKYDQSQRKSPLIYSNKKGYEHPQRKILSYDQRVKQYTNLNPQANYDSKFPQRIYSHLQLKQKQKNTKQFQHNLNNKRLDRISNMYDDKVGYNEKSPYRNNRNQYGPKNYHLHDQQDMYKNKMGMNRREVVGRKNQYFYQTPEKRGNHQRVGGFHHYREYK